MLNEPPTRRVPPATRYQGSKHKLLPWLATAFSQLRFETALDAFGGTGCVSYLLKSHGKAVTCNDYLKANYWMASGLIENDRVQLPEDRIELITRPDPTRSYRSFIRRTFRDVYFLDEENAWLDVACQNIPRLESRFERALAYYALFQSSLVKRPYNLFHRKNLYLRTASVERSFGNKTTWDKPFAVHFEAFVREANASVFGSGVGCRASNLDALEVPEDYDLVYIDPPYVSGRGIGVDYLDFYHFLEGMIDYGSWEGRLDRRRRHLPLTGERSPWSDPRRCREAFAALFERFADSILVVSYRSDGIPSESELIGMLRKVKSRVECIHYGEYKYVLSTNDRSREILLVAE